MRHQIIMHKIPVKRSHEIFITAVFKRYPVIRTGVVHESVDPSKLRHHLGHRLSALCRVGEFCSDLKAMWGVLFK